MFEDPKGRREFMTLMGASLALAGLTACTKQPEEKILPYVRQPEQLVLGRPLFFATAAGHDGYARGILVESHEGRPTKVEGNPDHPASLGGSDVFGQAHVLGLYDPDRAKTVLYLGQDRTWGGRAPRCARRSRSRRPRRGGAALPHRPRDLADPRRADGGRPRRLPAGEVGELGAGRPRPHPGGRGPGLRGAGRGAVPLRPGRRDPQPRGRLRRLAPGEPAPRARVRLPPQGGRREARDEPPLRGRGSPTSTGASADHRLALRSSEIEGFARAVAAGLGVPAEGGVPHAWPPRSRRT